MLSTHGNFPRRACVGLAGALLCSCSLAAAAAEIEVSPRTLPAIGKVDARFQSYNVEMAEVIGGRFWRPYSELNEPSGAAETATPSGQAVALNPRLFVARSPVDLGNHRLRLLAGALGPAFVRVSGSWANTAYFQDDDNAPLSTPPEGYRGVLTRTEWRSVIEFARDVDAKLVTSFAANPAVRDDAGVWRPVQAHQLMAYTHSIGGEVYAAELFNEPDLSGHAGGPAKYDGPAFARDIAAFRAFAAQDAPKMLVVGPGDANPATFKVPGSLSLEEMLRSEPQPRFDVFSYHFYPAVSQRCAPPIPPWGARPQDALSEEWLATTDLGIKARKALHDQYEPNTAIWLTETAGAACGGAPWDATFLDTFRYVDQMGRLAKQEVQVIFHNTLASSDYALIDAATLTPRPSYWTALLWRRLMGETVLDAGPLMPGLHIYAQCLRGKSGGVAVAAINLDPKTAASLRTPTAAEAYTLSADNLQSATVKLNGEPLQLNADDRLPALEPVRVAAGRTSLAPASITFLAFPEAGNVACQH